MAKSHLLK